MPTSCLVSPALRQTRRTRQIWVTSVHRQGASRGGHAKGREKVAPAESPAPLRGGSRRGTSWSDLQRVPRVTLQPSCLPVVSSVGISVAVLCGRAQLTVAVLRRDQLTMTVPFIQPLVAIEPVILLAPPPWRQEPRQPPRPWPAARRRRNRDGTDHESDREHLEGRAVAGVDTVHGDHIFWRGAGSNPVESADRACALVFQRCVLLSPGTGGTAICDIYPPVPREGLCWSRHGPWVVSATTDLGGG